jgi:hypothetical protein
MITGVNVMKILAGVVDPAEEGERVGLRTW